MKSIRTFLHLACTAPGRLRLPALAALLAVSACTTAPTDSAPPDYVLTDSAVWETDVTLPLRQRDAYLTVDARIDGRRAGRFLIDTGANRSVVDQGVAGRLGLNDLGGGTTLGVAGTSAVRYRGVDQLAFGCERTGLWIGAPARRLIGLSFRNVSHQLAGNVSGILSFRDLRETPFTIDPVARELTLHRSGTLRPPPGATVTPLEFHHGLPWVTVQLRGRDGTRVDVPCLIDTGSTGGLSLPRDLLRTAPGITSVPATSGSGVRGVGGMLRTTRTWVHTADLLGHAFADVPASFEDIPVKDANGDMIGRIGQKLLSRMRLTFDVPGGGVVYAIRVAP